MNRKDESLEQAQVYGSVQIFQCPPCQIVQDLRHEYFQNSDEFVTVAPDIAFPVGNTERLFRTLIISVQIPFKDNLLQIMFRICRVKSKNDDSCNVLYYCSSKTTVPVTRQPCFYFLSDVCRNYQPYILHPSRHKSAHRLN